MDKPQERDESKMLSTEPCPVANVANTEGDYDKDAVLKEITQRMNYVYNKSNGEFIGSASFLYNKTWLHCIATSLYNKIVEAIGKNKVHYVVTIEADGFLYGTWLARCFDAALICCRHKDTIPGATISVNIDITRQPAVNQSNVAAQHTQPFRSGVIASRRHRLYQSSLRRHARIRFVSRVRYNRNASNNRRGRRPSVCPPSGGSKSTSSLHIATDHIPQNLLKQMQPDPGDRRPSSTRNSRDPGDTHVPSNRPSDLLLPPPAEKTSDMQNCIIVDDYIQRGTALRATVKLIEFGTLLHVLACVAVVEPEASAGANKLRAGRTFVSLFQLTRNTAGTNASSNAASNNSSQSPHIQAP